MNINVSRSNPPVRSIPFPVSTTDLPKAVKNNDGANDTAANIPDDENKNPSDVNRISISDSPKSFENDNQSFSNSIDSLADNSTIFFRGKEVKIHAKQTPVEISSDVLPWLQPGITLTPFLQNAAKDYNRPPPPPRQYRPGAYVPLWLRPNYRISSARTSPEYQADILKEERKYNL